MGCRGLVTHHDWLTALQSLGGLTAAAGPLASCPPLVHQLAPKLIFWYQREKKKGGESRRKGGGGCKILGKRKRGKKKGGKKRVVI